MLTEYAALSDSLDTVAYSLEKEHVLLALTFEIDGRNGVLLCDPGYHVGRVITVMCDGVYPHTGEEKKSRSHSRLVALVLKCKPYAIFCVVFLFRQFKKRQPLHFLFLTQ